MSKKTSKFYARLLAIVLSVLMVVSMAFYTVYMIVENIKEAKEEEEKAESTAAIPSYTFTIWSTYNDANEPLSLW